jgi:quercetin dioxygenase-like cupin family protein
MRQPVIVSADSAPELKVVGITLLASGAQTGSYEVFHQAGPEGAGPPPHNHPWDEAFYVIRGELAFGVGAEEFVAKAGTFVHLPGGTTHWFRYRHGGGEMLSFTSGKGAADMFAEFDREMSPERPDRLKFTEIAARYGALIPAPLR